MNAKNLSWGYKTDLEAPIVWGARAILSAQGIELLWDRQDCLKEGATEAEIKDFSDDLNDALDTLRRHVMVEPFDPTSGEVRTVTFDGFTFVMSPNESYGYLYIAAIRARPTDTRTAEPPRHVYKCSKCFSVIGQQTKPKLLTCTGCRAAARNRLKKLSRGR